MTKSSLFCACVLWTLALPSAARAEDTVPPGGKLPDLLQTFRAVDVGQGQFQLQLPVLGKPLLISWQRGFAPGYEWLRMPVYDWDAHLLQRGSFDVVAFNRVRPAMALDCASVSCVPTIEKTRGAEVRLNLGGRGVVPASHLFLRRETVINGGRSYARFGFGLGGTLDL